MKNKKTFGLYDTNKKKTVENTDEYTEEFYDDYQENQEYNIETEYSKEECYDEEEYYEDDDTEYADGQDYEDEEDDEDVEYIVDYNNYSKHTYASEVQGKDNTYMEQESEADYDETEENIEDYEQALYAETSIAMELHDEVYSDESVFEDDAYSDEYYDDGDYAEDTESYYDTDEEYYYEDEQYYETEEYSDDYYYEEDDTFDIAYGTVNNSHQEDISGFAPQEIKGENPILGKIKSWVKNMTAFDAILACTGVVVIVAALVIFSMFLETRRINTQIQAIAPIGDELTQVGIVGEEGLLAMTDAAIAGNFENIIEETTEEISSVEVVDETEVSKVNVSFVSVERDLKIRFTDANTGELIKGTPFEVVLTNSKGKQLVLTDDDMDGIIYATSVNAGVFDAIVKSTDKYKFPTIAQQVTVKDKVQYVVINVQDEVKKENEVNVAVEDTQKQDAEKEAQTLKDTVEWVESSKTLISGSEGYLLVDKNTITDPAQVSRAAARMLFDTLKVELDNEKLSLYTGATATLTGTAFTDSSEGDIEYKYTTEWKSSDENIATVSDGVVSAKSPGKATITYTVTKKTITTTYEPKEPVEEVVEISVDEYEALEAAEKEKCTAIKDDADQVIGYTYKKVTEPQAVVNETAETATAECKVTVEDAKISSGSLELTKSAESCKVGETVTVSPSKLIYTKENGNVETITEGFPKIKWSSDNKEIAKVDENGVVTGIKAGTVTINAKVEGVKGTGDKKLDITASTTVTITEAAQLTVALDRTSEVYIGVGKTTTLVATVTNYKEDSGVTWKSSDEKIITVDEKGVVTGVAAGSATITASTKEKNAEGKAATATCVVTVNTSQSTDTTTKLKDKNGNQIYIKDADGKYKEAVYADYYKIDEFYIQTEGQYMYTGWQTINGKTYYYDKNGNPVTGAQVIQGVTYTFGSDGAIATKVNGSTFGIDISRHNGNIDWNAVKASGVDYVILRCGYRGSATGVLIEDETFKKNIKGATAAGLKVGVYVFSQAINEVEAVKEASLAVSLVKGYNLTYPIFIDTESSGGRADRIDVATRTAVVNAFCQTVASAGYQPGIYASKTWFEDKLNMSAIGNYKIWLAQYSAEPTYKGRYDMWQYTSKGKINGIKGNVDLNLSYMGY